VAGVILLAVGFVWVWWKGVPTLYRDAGGGPAENARLSAVTTTRAALLAGLGPVFKLLTFLTWLVHRFFLWCSSSRHEIRA
jgi:hypothetical protein